MLSTNLSKKSLLSKIGASALCGIFALSLSIPTAAFAAAETDAADAAVESEVRDGWSGSFAFATKSISIPKGVQVPLEPIFNPEVSPSSTQPSHVDYGVISGGDIAKVTKHGGYFTATATGDVEVKAVFVKGEMPEPNPNPDGTPVFPDGEVLGTPAILKITVTSSETYGFQGGRNAIKLITTEQGALTGYASYNNVAYTPVSGGTVYLNSATDINNQEGKLTAYGEGANAAYYFTIQMTNGFRTYNSPEKFAEINAYQVSFQKTGSDNQEYLNETNSGALTVVKTDMTNKTIVFKLMKSAIQNGSGTLTFDSGFRGNNASNTLGTPVSFTFSA